MGLLRSTEALAPGGQETQMESLTELLPRGDEEADTQCAAGDASVGYQIGAQGHYSEE